MITRTPVRRAFLIDEKCVCLLYRLRGRLVESLSREVMGFIFHYTSHGDPLVFRNCGFANGVPCHTFNSVQPVIFRLLSLAGWEWKFFIDAKNYI